MGEHVVVINRKSPRMKRKENVSVCKREEICIYMCNLKGRREGMNTVWIVDMVRCVGR